VVSQIERKARNQSLFRDVNEEIEALHDQRFSADDWFTIVCECGGAGCAERIELTREEYEALRADPTHFLVAQGHVDGDVDCLVVQRDGYAIVANVGVAAHIARRTYPRTGAQG
jgi:hypothetical protein